MPPATRMPDLNPKNRSAEQQISDLLDVGLAHMSAGLGFRI